MKRNGGEKKHLGKSSQVEGISGKVEIPGESPDEKIGVIQKFQAHANKTSGDRKTWGLAEKSKEILEKMGMLRSRAHLKTG